MPQTGWQPLPNGDVSFDHPAGPLVLGGPDAAAEAARRDAAAGDIKPLDFYQGIARRESMATSPGALAQASPIASSDGPSQSDAGYTPAQAPEAPGVSVPDASEPISRPVPPLRESREAPPAPSPGVVPSQGPALPEDWGQIRGDKPLGQWWQERKTLHGNGDVDPANVAASASLAGARARDLAQGVNPDTGAPAASPQPVAADSGTGPAPAAVDPSKVVTGGKKPGGGGVGGKVFQDARATLDEHTQYQQGAVEAADQSRQAGDARTADAMREQNAIDATAQAGREARLAELQRRSAQFEESVSQKLSDADKMKIDPHRYMSSRTLGQRIMLGIGAFFAGAGGGDSNAVLDMINKRTDQDIRAQIENRDAKLKSASATQALYKDYLATFKDHDEAILATATTAKLGIAKAAMQQALEVGSPEQIAKANELHSKLLEQQAAQYAQLAQQRAAAAAKGAGSAAAAAKKQRTITIGGVAYPVRPNMPDAEYNKMSEEALKVDRVFRTVDQAANDKGEQPGLLDRAAAAVGYKTAPVIRAEANADSVQSADSQLSGEGTSSETAVKTGREKYGGMNREAGLAEERRKARAAANDLVRRISE